jgi:geranylgeranyl reductase
MRARRVVDRAALVGDAAGYVTKCSGEGIYFAAKSGRMAGEAVDKVVRATGRLPNQQQMIQEYIKPYDSLYGPTYTVLDILQRVFYTSNAAREAFVELCKSEYVQRVTFNSYLYKKVQGRTVMRLMMMLMLRRMIMMLMLMLLRMILMLMLLRMMIMMMMLRMMMMMMMMITNHICSHRVK